MKRWADEIVEGRVFELRSRSKRYPAPCALVINDHGNGWNERMFASVGPLGIVDHCTYCWRINPDIYVDGLHREDFKSSRVRCRRHDLERFDADDLRIIRYGLALEFSGRIHSMYSDMTIPIAVPADWTLFWVSAWEKDDYRFIPLDINTELQPLLNGAWHFESHGGKRYLGYKFGHAWATRHSGSRLNQIRQFLRARIGGLIEQPVKVVCWREGENVFTEEVRRDCPVLGGRGCIVESPSGIHGIYR